LGGGKKRKRQFCASGKEGLKQIIQIENGVEKKEVRVRE